MKAKKILFLAVLIGFFFVNETTYGQKTYCNLVENYTKDAKKLYAGEILMVVPEGYELWVRMDPSASWNQGENGGCRLKSGQKYVADVTTGEAKRAWKCGNKIVESYLYRIAETSTTYTSGQDVFPVNTNSTTGTTTTQNSNGVTVVVLNGGCGNCETQNSGTSTTTTSTTTTSTQGGSSSTGWMTVSPHQPSGGVYSQSAQLPINYNYQTAPPKPFWMTVGGKIIQGFLYSLAGGLVIFVAGDLISDGNIDWNWVKETSEEKSNETWDHNNPKRSFSSNGYGFKIGFVKNQFTGGNNFSIGYSFSL